MTAFIRAPFAAGCCLLLIAAACTPDSSAQRDSVSPQPVAAPTTQPRTFLLSIVAYNYTDRYIDSFEVNGQAGGNVDISNANSGGGKSACCVRWLEGSALPRMIRIKWVGGYCMLRETNSSGESFLFREPLWKAASMAFSGPVPANPTTFEVHFYRDDRVELAMTEQPSPPKLILPSPPTGYVRPGVTVNDPTCPADYDRQRASQHSQEVSLPKELRS